MEKETQTTSTGSKVCYEDKTVNSNESYEGRLASSSSYLCADIPAGQLPAFIEKAISVAQQPHMQDMIFLSTLAACGYAMPHVKMLHGMPQHAYYPNLMFLIVASAASGKNVMNCAARLLDPLERQLMLDNRIVFIPANSSSAAFSELFHANGGRGFILATEIDEMSKVWKKDYCDYSEFLRLAAEHETKRHARVRPGKGVVLQTALTPRLSVLLSGTPAQLKPLIGSRENGLASRFQPYLVTDRTPFNRAVVENGDHYVTGGADEVMEALSEQLYARWQWLSAQDHDCLWSLTKEQEQVLGNIGEDCDRLLFLEDNYSDDGRRLGMPLSFDANFRRSLVTIKRIGMILSVLRLEGDTLPEHLYCSDEDFATMLILLEKFLHHSATMALVLPEEESLDIPAMNAKTAAAASRANSLLDVLPEKFTTVQAFSVGKEWGLSEQTVYRYLHQFKEDKQIKQLGKSHYIKVI